MGAGVVILLHGLPLLVLSVDFRKLSAHYAILIPVKSFTGLNQSLLDYF